MYSLALLGMSILGVNMVLLTIVALVMRVRNRRHPVAVVPAPAEADWPSVLVQLPLYNERYVVERLLDAVVAMDYPADKLTIQVLDDSTDDTPAIARSRAAYHRARGHAVLYQHRTDRTGFKAGALGAGLAATAQGEFVAVFHAHFFPPPDFPRRLVPQFRGGPRPSVV